eukprot:403376426
METTTSTHLTQALVQLALGNHHTVLFHLSQEPPSFVAKLTQASVNVTLGKYELAIDLLNEQQPTAQGGQIPQLLYVRAKALFLSGHFEKAAQDLNRAKENLANIGDELERKDLERQVNLLERKVQIETLQVSSIGNINDAAYLKSSKEEVKETKMQDVQSNGNGAPQSQVQAQPTKVVPLIDPKYDWYQNATHVFISYKVANPQVSEQTQITFDANSVTLIYADQVAINLQLSNPIIPDQSTKTTTGKKIELKLKKETENAAWMKIEAQGEAKLFAASTQIPTQTISPSYPTSSKQKKDWSKMDKEIEKDLAKEKPEGEGALNALFKQIYDRADEDTRRAMIKSYQTSGGTVLSTNWDEVAKKDYEGQDRPDAPDGQQWAKDN